MLGPWLRLIVVIVGIGAAFLPVPASAATFVVTRQDDPAPDGCNSGVDCSLREAIIAANATTDPDDITLSNATYSLSIPGVAEQEAATGDLDVTQPLTINGQGAGATVVEAGANTAAGIDRVFDVRSGSLTLNGLTVRHGNAGAAGGGGISVSSGASLTVSSSTITLNTAGTNGGGISNSGTLTMTNSTVSGNTTATGGASDQSGGGIATFSSGSMSLTNVVVSGNSAGRFGGGVHNSATGSTITGGSITGNSTPTGITAGTRDGGGINNASPGSLTINNVSITNNSAGRDGGGIANSSTLIINNGTSITGNSTSAPDPGDPNVNDHNGGGIRNFSPGILTISDSTISTNTAFRSGGGMAAQGQAELTNTTVLSNHAANSGGGLNNFSSIVNGVQSKLKITGGTVSQNTAGLSGGGIIGSSTVEINGTTISSNQAGTIGLASGGGAAVFVSTTPGITTQLIMSGATVNGNSASGSGGGVAGTGILTITSSAITNNNAGTTGSGNGGGVAGFLPSTEGITTVLNLTNVTATGNTSTGGSGGGISAFGADLNITGGTIQNNSTNFDGGGIAKGTATSGPLSHTSVAKILNALIKDNHGTTASSDGGGVANIAGPLEIRGSTIEDNDVLGFGGGLGNFNGGVTTVFNSTIRNNEAGQGGGGITQNNSSSPSITLTDTTVSGNKAMASTGGGISAGGGAVTLLRATLNGNNAATGGGGVHVSTTATLNATASTFSSNTTPQNGGGLQSSGSSTATNVTFQSNQAAGGGAIRVFSGTTTVRNSIMANNTGGNCLGALTSQGNNLEFPGNTCGLNPGLGDILNANPLLGALANNGGPTLTHLPAANSPVIDAGTNAGCGPLDQRQTGRPIDGNGDGNNVCDIGSVEASTRPFVACGTRPNVSAAPAPGQPGRIQATITAQGANNQIHSLRIVTSSQIAPNFVVDIVGGPQNVTGPIVYVTPPGTVQVALFIERINPGAATVPMVVTDSCGEWQTFVGGGTRAFQ